MSGELGSGAGKGGGAGGAIREAGGAFGRLEAAREEEFFYKKVSFCCCFLLQKLSSTIILSYLIAFYIVYLHNNSPSSSCIAWRRNRLTSSTGTRARSGSTSWPSFVTRSSWRRWRRSKGVLYLSQSPQFNRKPYLKDNIYPALHRNMHPHSSLGEVVTESCHGHRSERI